ncbi:virion protein [Oceanospirillum phage vB_OliS_GJ44]|nr:virion protein [Oceanospirillum phage vB_OliS_GJ44]
MATIVVETGSGDNPTAKTYASVAELQSYAADRGLTIVAADPSVLLIQAMDYIESQAFIGYKASEVQPLQWPRVDAYIDGFTVGSDVIPADLKLAQIATALSIDSGVDPLSVLGRAVKSESLGPMSTEYMDNADTDVTIRTISSRLRKLIVQSGGEMRALR